MKKSILKLIFIVSVIFLLVLITVYKLLLSREHSNWKEIIKFEDGEIVEVYNYFSNLKEYGFKGHANRIGFNNPIHKMKFDYKKKSYKWNGKFIPLLLNIENGVIYLCVFDRETDFPNIGFRYYKYDKKWSEIKPGDFPKSIAVQNLWLKGEIDDSDPKVMCKDEILDKIYKSDFFSDSLTAKIWLELEKGIKFYNAPQDVDKDFLTEFKNKYFKNLEIIEKNINSRKSEISVRVGGSSPEFIRVDWYYRKTTSKTWVYIKIILFILFILIIDVFMFKRLNRITDLKKRTFYRLLFKFSNISFTFIFVYFIFFNTFVKIYIYFVFYLLRLER